MIQKVVYVLILYIFVYLIVKTYIQKKISQSAKNLPQWFDKNLQNHFNLKVNKEKKVYSKFNNVIYLILYCSYAFFNNKKFYPFLNWEDIEKSIDYCLNNIKDCDVIIGIKSGGAYITKYIANKKQLPYDYIKTERNVGFTKLIGRGIFKSEKIQKSDYIIKEIPSIDVTNKRVLLVDDAVLSGGTMKTVEKFLIEKGAKQVIKFVLHGHDNKDICMCANKSVIFAGPWGFL
jgi:hypoxanthine phosphoribosyltransferase